MHNASPFGRSLQATRRRLSQALFWNRFTAWAGWGLLASGVAVLLGKLLSPQATLAGVALALAVPAAAAIAGLLRKRRISEIDAAILLDRSGGLDGFPLLLMAHPESGWSGRAAALVPRASAAVPRVAFGRFARRLLPGGAFLLATLLLPQQQNFGAADLSRRNSAASREVQRLEQKIEELKEKNALPDKELEQLRNEIQSLEENAAAKKFSQEGWEALDHLSERMQKGVRERSAALARAAAAAEQMAGSIEAKGLDEALAAEKAEALQRAMLDLRGVRLPGEFEDLLKKMAQPKALDGMDPEALRKMMKDLQEFLDRESQELARERGEEKPGG